MRLAKTTVIPPGSTCFIDLTGFLHRLAYMPGPRGIKPAEVTSRKTGEPTWGIVGTFNQLHTLAKQQPAAIIAFADSSQNGFRQDLLPEYKRKSGNPYIRAQLDRLATTLPLMGIPVHGAQEEHPGMEAEDLIAKAALSAAEPAIIVSYDKDLLQLVNDTVSHYNPARGELIAAANVDAHLRRNFIPTKTALLSGRDLAVCLAVTGDSSDGVKGIGGIGPATLAKYYDQLPTDLDTNMKKIEALAEIDQAARGGKTTANWPQALTNLAAVDLATQRQQDIVLDHKPVPSPDREGFRQVLEDLTMPSFLNILDQWFAPFEAMKQWRAEVQMFAMT